MIFSGWITSAIQSSASLPWFSTTYLLNRRQTPSCQRRYWIRPCRNSSQTCVPVKKITQFNKMMITNILALHLLQSAWVAANELHGECCKPVSSVFWESAAALTAPSLAQPPTGSGQSQTPGRPGGPCSPGRPGSPASPRKLGPDGTTLLASETSKVTCVSEKCSNEKWT